MVLPPILVFQCNHLITKTFSLCTRQKLSCFNSSFAKPQTQLYALFSSFLKLNQLTFLLVYENRNISLYLQKLLFSFPGNIILIKKKTLIQSKQNKIFQSYLNVFFSRLTEDDVEITLKYFVLKNYLSQ